MRIPTFIAALIVAVSPLLDATADADAPYPVWFHPSLGIETVEDVEGKLDEPFWEAGRFILVGELKAKYVGGPKIDHPALSAKDLVEDPIAVSTCRQLLRAHGSPSYRDYSIGWKNRNNEAVGEIRSGDERPTFAKDYLSRRRYLSVYHGCLALEQLRNARSSTVSHVRDFELDANAPLLLPATFADRLSRFGSVNACRGHHAGQTWAAIDGLQFRQADVPETGEGPTAKTGSASPRTFVTVSALEQALASRGANGEGQYDAQSAAYQAGVHTQTMRVWARADFDGDGNEDLLIVNTVSYHGTKVTWTDRPHIVTRESPGGVLTEIEPNKYPQELRWPAILCSEGHF